MSTRVAGQLTCADDAGVEEAFSFALFYTGTLVYTGTGTGRRAIAGPEVQLYAPKKLQGSIEMCTVINGVIISKVIYKKCNWGLCFISLWKILYRKTGLKKCMEGVAH